MMLGGVHIDGDAAVVALLIVLAYLVYRVYRLETRVALLAHTRARRRRFRGRPDLIVLVRHGESEGNVDHTAYTRVADPRMPLTARGVRQARAAGPALRALVGKGRPVFAYASPYRRARQTARLALGGLGEGVVQALVEDPRLREQEFAGSYQEPPPDEPQTETDDDDDDDDGGGRDGGNGDGDGDAGTDADGGTPDGADAIPPPTFLARQGNSSFRARNPSLHCPDRSFGALSSTPGGRKRKPYPKFYFRYAGGESAADVYDRVSLFMDSLWRDFTREDFKGSAVVIVAHGLVNRLFLMRWLHWPPEKFARTTNPGNCGMLVLRLQPPDAHGRQYYMLDAASARSLGLREQDCARPTPRPRGPSGEWGPTPRGKFGADNTSLPRVQSLPKLRPRASERRRASEPNPAAGRRRHDDGKND